MAVDSSIRHKVHTSAKRALGDQEGDALMELLPPIGWDDFATKNDVTTAVTLAKLETIAVFREELTSAVTSQTKTVVWAFVGLAFTLLGLYVALVTLTR